MRRNDVARIAADGIEDRLQQNVCRTHARQLRLDQASVGAGAARHKLGSQCADRGGDAAGGRSVYEQIGGIGIDRDVGRDALEHVTLGAGRDIDGGEGLAVVDRRTSLARVRARTVTLNAPLASSVSTIWRLSSVRSLSTTAMGPCAGSGSDKAGIIDAVDQRSEEQNAEGAPRSQDTPPLRHEGAADAARCRVARAALGRPRPFEPALRVRLAMRSHARTAKSSASPASAAKATRNRRPAIPAPLVRATRPCTSAAAGPRSRHGRTCSCRA